MFECTTEEMLNLMVEEKVESMRMVNLLKGDAYVEEITY